VTPMCHPEAKPKELANEKEVIRFAQNDSFTVTLFLFRHFLPSRGPGTAVRHFLISFLPVSNIDTYHSVHIT